MEQVPPLVTANSEGTYPDPAGVELKQLHMKDTLHKSDLTLQKKRSDHRHAVITEDRWVSLFFPPWGINANPWFVSISTFLSGIGGSICREDNTRSSGSSSRQTHDVAVACLRRHTKEPRNGRGSVPVLRRPISLCVCVCGNLTTGRRPTKLTLFPLKLPLLHALTHVVSASMKQQLQISPAWFGDTHLSYTSSVCLFPAFVELLLHVVHCSLPKAYLLRWHTLLIPDPALSVLRGGSHLV